jgi:hypothetical protein
MGVAANGRGHSPSVAVQEEATTRAKALFTMGLAGLKTYWTPLFTFVINM